MILRKDSWSHSEDKFVIDTLLDYAKRGEQQKDAFTYLGEVMINRTSSAITQRWFLVLRKTVLRNPALYSTDQATPKVMKAVTEAPEPPLPNLTVSVCIDILSCQHLDQENTEIVNRVLKKLLLGG